MKTASFLKMAFISQVLFSCSQKESPGSPKLPTTGESIAAQAQQAASSSCEVSLRTALSNKTIMFSPSKQFEKEVAAANDFLKTGFGSNADSKSEYSLAQQKDFTTEIEVAHFIKSASRSTTVTYKMARASGEAQDRLFNLTTAFRTIQPSEELEFTQKYIVDSKCQLKLSMTSLAKTTDDGSDQYSFSIDANFGDAQPSSEFKKFSLPPGAKLVNLMIGQDKIETIPRSGFGFVDQVGVVTFVVTDAETKTAKAFGLELHVPLKNLKIYQGTQLILESNEGIDENLKIRMSATGSQAEWTVPKELWDKTLLSVGEPNAAARSDLTTAYLNASNSIELVTNRLPTYEHFSAYDTISNQSFDEKTKHFTLILTQSQSPTFAEKSLPSDLESYDTIQTHIPKIESIVKGILSKDKSDRRAQVEDILAYLKKNYPYDYDMLNNNTVRPFTTEEALDRGKGVCQHYAVIFTALARAMNIPTRIIAGYYLSEGIAGAHAWVETQIVPGIWRVIEPQDPDSINGLATRVYFPTYHDTLFEDKSKNITDIIRTVFNEDYFFHPVP